MTLGKMRQKIIQKIIEILTRRTHFTPTQYTSKHLIFYFYINNNRMHSFQNKMIFDLWNVRWNIKIIFWNSISTECIQNFWKSLMPLLWDSRYTYLKFYVYRKEKSFTFVSTFTDKTCPSGFTFNEYSRAAKDVHELRAYASSGYVCYGKGSGKNSLQFKNRFDFVSLFIDSKISIIEGELLSRHNI